MTAHDRTPTRAEEAFEKWWQGAPELAALNPHNAADGGSPPRAYALAGFLAGAARLDEVERRVAKLDEAAGHIVFSAERENASDQYFRVPATFITALAAALENRDG